MWRGIADATPFSLVIGILGVLFGAGAGAAGIGGAGANLMSLLVFSGSAQFAAMGLWSQGGWAVLLSTVLLSSRFILMSASLAAQLPPIPRWQRALMGAAVSDEAYGLFIAPGPHKGVDYLAGAMVALYSPWLVGTVIGVATGAAIPLSWQPVLYAIFPLMFLTLTVLASNTRLKVAVAILAALLAAAGSRWLPGGWNMLAAGLLAGAAGALLEPLQRRAGEVKPS